MTKIIRVQNFNEFRDKLLFTTYIGLVTTSSGWVGAGRLRTTISPGRTARF